MTNLAMVMLVPILLVGAIENPSLGVLRLEERENELCIDEPIVPTSIGACGVKSYGPFVGDPVFFEVGRNIGRFSGHSIVTLCPPNGCCCLPTVLLSLVPIYR
jgi:hypothetical protein